MLKNIILVIDKVIAMSYNNNNNNNQYIYKQRQSHAMSQRRWLATAVIFRPSDVSFGFAETWTVIAPATAETLEGGSRALVRRWRKPVDQWLSETAVRENENKGNCVPSDLKSWVRHCAVASDPSRCASLGLNPSSRPLTIENFLVFTWKRHVFLYSGMIIVMFTIYLPLHAIADCDKLTKPACSTVDRSNR